MPAARVDSLATSVRASYSPTGPAGRVSQSLFCQLPVDSGSRSRRVDQATTTRPLATGARGHGLRRRDSPPSLARLTNRKHGAMTQIAKIEIHNFRGIRQLIWLPKPGINCLVGPGDCGKSTVLQAIDWCIGARRSLPLSDADFLPRPGRALNSHRGHPSKISTTACSALTPTASTSADSTPRQAPSRIEPAEHLRDVLSVQLKIDDDLDPNWTLVSERAAAQGSARDLSWKDRIRIAPAWIGGFVAHSLAWRPGSVVTKISDEADGRVSCAPPPQLAQPGRSSEPPDVPWLRTSPFDSQTDREAARCPKRQNRHRHARRSVRISHRGRHLTSRWRRCAPA